MKEHIAAYGYGIEERLTGEHETAPYTKFSYGVSNRGASVRIPGGRRRGEARLPGRPSSERQHRPLRGLGDHHRDHLRPAAREKAPAKKAPAKKAAAKKVAKKATAKKATSTR